MMDVPHRAVAIAAAGASWESELVREVEAASELTLARRCMDVAELLAVAGVTADLAVVDVELPGLDVDAVAALQTKGVLVVGIGAQNRACSLGISLIAPPGELVATIAVSGAAAPASAVSLSAQEPHRKGRMLAVWGPLGAPGRSTVALTVAAELANRGDSVILVDADTYGGSQAQQIALLDDVSGLMAACRDANRGQAGSVRNHLAKIGDGLDLLTGLPRPDMWQALRPSAFDLVLAELREQFDQVVIDCGFCLEEVDGTGGGRNRITLQTLREADLVVTVGRADPVGLARLVRGLHELRPILSNDPVVVLNRVRSSLGWDSRELLATVHRLGAVVPAALLPDDPSGLDTAAMTGKLPHVAAPDSPFVAEIARLVGVLGKRDGTRLVAAS